MARTKEKEESKPMEPVRRAKRIDMINIYPKYNMVETGFSICNLLLKYKTAYPKT